MKKRFLFVLALTTGLIGWSAAARASIITFTATLSGSQEAPPHVVPGFGFGTVVLNDVADTITVDESWFNLTAGASASHIHGPGAPGVNVPVLFPLNLGLGVGTTTGAIQEQIFPITLPQITQLEAGLFYMNVHTSTFPGGEIRGQLTAVPEPATLTLLGTGVLGLASRIRRRAGRTRT